MHRCRCRSSCLVTHWPVQPAAQQAAAHGGGRAVEHADQGVLALAGNRLFQFQVAAGGGIQYQAVAAVLDLQTAQMRQGGTLRVPDILQQRAGGADGGRQVLAAETAQVRVPNCSVSRPRALPVSKDQGGW